MVSPVSVVYSHLQRGVDGTTGARSMCVFKDTIKDEDIVLLPHSGTSGTQAERRWRSCPGSPGPGAARGVPTGRTLSAPRRSSPCRSWSGCCTRGRRPATTPTKCGPGSTLETSELYNSFLTCVPCLKVSHFVTLNFSSLILAPSQVNFICIVLNSYSYSLKGLYRPR